jgi:hypothetical protein
MLSNPRESNWEAVAEGAALAIKEESRNCSFSKKQKKHRRGRFPALATGVSHGGGQRVRPLVSLKWPRLIFFCSILATFVIIKTTLPLSNDFVQM